VEIKILFDKEAINRNLYIGWGESFLIDKRILFDTGENGSWLLENIRNLKVDIEKITSVVISHDHWDHAGGLWELLRNRKGLKVYICPNFDAGFKDKVEELKGKIIEKERITEIAKDIFVTGEIAGEYKKKYIAEQALIIRTKKGLTIVTGCSHPGITKIVNQVKEDFSDMKIYLVFGGFHLVDKYAREIRIIVEELKKMGVEKVGPTHCTGYRAQMVFKELYKEDFIPIKTGMTFEV